MVRLLCLFFVGDWHRHYWDIHQEIRVFDGDGGSRPIARHYHLRCRECGDLKVRKL